MMRALAETYADFDRAVAAERARPVHHERSGVRGTDARREAGCAGRRRSSRPYRFCRPSMRRFCRRLPWLWRLQALGPRVYGTILAPAKRAARNLRQPSLRLPSHAGLPPVSDPFFDDKHAPDLVLAMFSRLLGEPRPDWPRQTVVTGFAFYDGEPDLASDVSAFLEPGHAGRLHARLGGGFRSGRFFRRASALRRSPDAAPCCSSVPSPTGWPSPSRRRRRIRVRAFLKTVSRGRHHRPSRGIGYYRPGDARGRPMIDRAVRPRPAGQRDARSASSESRRRFAAASTPRRGWPPRSNRSWATLTLARGRPGRQHRLARGRRHGRRRRHRTRVRRLPVGQSVLDTLIGST